jgi:GNAT superfamily N-acetyltransferase
MISTKDNINLRRATEKDIDILIEYRLVFLKEIHGAPAAEFEDQLKISLRKYFERSLNTDEYISWLAEIADRPVGFSGMVIREQPGNFDLPDGKSGYILNIYTVKEFRNKGIASMLMQKLIEEARIHNLSRVELRATPAGEAVYRKIGFTEPHDLPMELSLG